MKESVAMANADNEMPPYACGGAGENFRRRPCRPEICEEAQNVSHQCGNFATFGKSELEEMLKQMTFTRSEAQHFISLLHSRTIEVENPPTPVSRLEASTTSGTLKKHKHGDASSRVLEEEIVSPAHRRTQDSKLVNCNATSTFLLITSPQHHPTTMENLPDELLSNIFLRLFAKQLAQMRSVSKSWNALLSHPSFIKSHLHHSVHNNDQILLLFHNEEATKLFTAKLSRSPSLKLTNFIKLPVNLQIQSEHINGIRVIGSVNGLICYSYNDDLFIQIWNPSLSAILTLPPYSTPSTGDQTFREIPIPDSMLDYKNGSNVLGVLAGKLCVMLSGIENDVYEMWVMEYGVAESWVKHRVFSQFSPYIYLFGFTPRNEILFEDEGDLLLYDPYTNKQKILANYCPEEDGVDKIVEYVDSLVWIARA
ncbi:hypothetical protein LXL04_002261 [Taraxacum kok-saghyz]